METTHYIEVFKSCGIFFQTKPMDILAFKEDDSTVALWRIKPTDVPLEERLAARIGGFSGSKCSQEYYQKSLVFMKYLKNQLNTAHNAY